MNKLSEKEQTVAREIIEKGIVEAAKALSYFIKSEVEIQVEDTYNVREKLDSMFEAEKEKLYLLCTRLKGEMKGVSILIFTKEQVEKIVIGFFGEKVLEKPERLEKKTNSLMLEIDNIISAAVVGKFSDIFEFHTYGDVPHLEIVEAENARKRIKAVLNENEYIVDIKTNLISDGKAIKADFIWALDEVFLEGVRNFAE